MSAKKISPTLQQEQALQAFLSKSSLKVNALAGSGKTSTLQLMAEQHKGKGIYLAFNKTIAEEAASQFPARVKARTSHSLAYSAIAKKGFSTHQLTAKLNANAIVQCLQLKSLSLSSKNNLSARQLAFMASETIRQFTQSEASQISAPMVPLLGAFQTLSPAFQLQLQKAVSVIAENLWQRMIDPLDESVPLGHDGYFKYWTLTAPPIQADYLMLDEAQDSNPALLKVLQQQSCQVVYVGDRFQQIYQWRGAINAMEKIQTQAQVMLSQSFRFGPAIAEHATQILRLFDPQIELLGNPQVKSQIGCHQPQTILSRSNASTVAHLLASLAIGRKPYLVGGVQELRWLLNDVSLLKRDQAATHPEFFGFNSWLQVQQFTERLEGEHLLKLTKLVEQHGEASILKALEHSCEDEAQADLILSTAHKSKGREWDKVMLDDDFFAPKLATEVKPNPSSELAKNTPNKEIEIKGPNGQNYCMAAEEIRLLYVATTRAKKALQIPEWSARFFELHQDSFSPTALLQAQPVMNKQAKSALVQNRQNAEAQNTSALISKPSPINSASRDSFKINDKQNMDSPALQSPNSSKRYYEKMINAQLLFWASPIGATVMGFMSLLLFAVLFYWFNRY